MAESDPGCVRTGLLHLIRTVEEWVVEDNPVRVIDAFVDELELSDLGFSEVFLKRPAGLPIIRRCC